MGLGSLVIRTGGGRGSSLRYVALAALVTAAAAAGCGSPVTERPCTAICNGPTPVCDPVARRCVGCLSDDDCPMGEICADTACKPGCSMGRPACPAGKMCDLQLAICRGCRADGECSDPAQPRCEVAKERCVPCLPTADNCKAGTRCRPKGDTYECNNTCKVKADCAGGPMNVDCCNGLCTELTTADHCGACGRSCGGTSCCGGTCVDTTADVKNCGGCGTACALPNATAGCAASKCTITACVSGFGDCNQQVMDGCEADLSGEVLHCGACGAACPMVMGGTPACMMGVCGIGMCNAGLADCDNVSMNGCEVDTGSDPAHCNGCGMSCPAPPNAVRTCTLGACGIGGCRMGFSDCDKVMMNGCEVNTGSDINNCGACGKMCSIPNASPLCLVGACVVGNCTVGYKDCNGQLVDGCEINAAIDSSNCGSCGNSCLNTPHATAACAGGVCGIGKCDPGWGNCDNMANNGCETSTVADPLNCGACAMKCPAPPNVVTTCTNGVCAMGGCAQGYADCNNNLNDGCESKLSDDAKNCSKCGMACAAIANGAAGCSMGICGIGMCNAGFADCDKVLNTGCEINTDTDARNCGGCGNACAGNQPCIGGKCTSSGCPPKAFFTGGLPATLVNSNGAAYGMFAFDGAGNLLAVTGGQTNWIYSVNINSNAVTQLVALPAGTWVSIAYSPVNDTVYVGDSSGNVSSYGLGNKVLTNNIVNMGGQSLNALAMAPQPFGNYGGQLIAGNYSGTVVAWDINNKIKTTVAQGAGQISAMAFHSSGVLYATDYGSTRINKITANGVVSQFTVVAGASDGLAMDEGRNRLYVANSSNQRIHNVNLANGMVTDFIGNYGFDGGYWPTPFVFDCVNTLLVAINPGAPTRVTAVTVP